MPHLLPSLVRRPLRDLHRTLTLQRAFAQFMRDPRGAAQRPGDLFERLAYGWGNSGWSGKSEYLRGCINAALDCDGAILECGSGLTTLLVGAVAQARGQSMWTLEHMPEWAQRVRRALDRLKVEAVRLCDAPLRDYGTFDWYAAPLEAMPERFALVICDGPPSMTRGGRYGLGPVMQSRLRPGCTILLDDACRSEEQGVAARWSDELALSCDLGGADQSYFVLSSPAPQS